MTSPTTPLITAGRAEELEAVSSLLERVGLPADGLADTRDTLLVARDGERLVGCAALECYPDGALLRSVAVAPEVRDRGLGIALTDAALALAREREIARIFLLTETAVSFFRRFGFRPVERTAVPPGVRQSVEFRGACPASAVVMMRSEA